MKFSQAHADVAGVIGANPLLLYPDVDEVIVNRRVAGHAIFARELTRRGVRCHGQQFSFSWIDMTRIKRNERVAQIVDRFFVFGPSGSHANGKYKNENGLRIHESLISHGLFRFLAPVNLKKARSRKATWPFCQRRPNLERLRQRAYFEYPD